MPVPPCRTTIRPREGQDPALCQAAAPDCAGRSGCTPITLADGTTKPVAAIRPGDMVLSPDKTGTLVPARVTRTFVNDVAHVLDFHGTGVTSGHVFLRGAGRFKGRHVPLIDILRDDGAVVRQDGSLMRGATGCAVGSDGDRLNEVVAADGSTGWVRAATLTYGLSSLTHLNSCANFLIKSDVALRLGRQRRCRRNRQVRAERLRSGGGEANKPVTNMHLEHVVMDTRKP
ncbi:MAG: hypothetical protein INF46_09345 [Rhodobacter sp.]|nr:hypothetical protein [Rhodobacter sp.]